MTREKRRNIPTFASYEEEALFWDHHSLAEFEDELEVVENMVVARPLKHLLSLALDGAIIGELTEVAKHQGLGLSSLVRRWLLERLEQERNQRPKKVEGLGH